MVTSVYIAGIDLKKVKYSQARWRKRTREDVVSVVF